MAMSLAVAFVLSSGLPAWGLNLFPWNGVGSLQAALEICAGNPIYDGVWVQANWNQDLIIPAGFADHSVVDLDPFEGRVIVVGTNAQGQPYRLARQLEVPAATGAGELRIQGGWLGNVDHVQYDGAVCSIQNSAVVFQGTRFSRHQLQDGNINQPCTLDNQGPLVVVDGTQGFETNSESGTGFIYSVSRTVDFKDCTFQPILNFTASGCTQVEFPDPLLVASNTRVRLLRPVVDVIDYGYAFEFAQSPIQCTSSLVHIEEATFTALQVQAGEAGFLKVAGSPDMGATPGFFLRDELLDGEIFTTILEAKVSVEQWRRHTNTVRPLSSLGNRPPAPEVYRRPPLGAAA